MYKYVLLCGVAFAFCSCGSHSKTNTSSGAHEKTSILSSIHNMEKAAKKVKKNQKDLIKATPLTNDQWKTWMPDELDGMKRTSYSIGGMSIMKLSTMDATYANKDQSNKIELNVTDGADSLGAGVIALARMSLSMDYEREDSTHVEKTVKKDNYKALVKYQKDNSSSSIEFIAKDRFIVKLNGSNIKVDQLWDAVKELKPDNLGK